MQEQALVDGLRKKKKISKGEAKLLHRLKLKLLVKSITDRSTEIYLTGLSSSPQMMWKRLKNSHLGTKSAGTKTAPSLILPEYPATTDIALKVSLF